MKAVVEIILPVFGVMFLGLAAARAGAFDAAANRGLSLFVSTFAIPLLLFGAMAHAELPEAMPWGFLMSYYGGAFAVLGLGMLVGWLASRRLEEQAIFGLGASFSNTALLGIPLVLTAFGDAAALPLFLLIAFHSLLLLPAVTVVVEVGRGRGGSIRQIPLRAARGVIKNPMILGLLAGLAFGITGTAVPALVDAMAKALGAAAAPCALFAMGGSLSQHRIRGDLREAMALAALKLLLHPLIVWVLATWVFDMGPLWTHVAVVMAALPAGVTTYVLAQRFATAVPIATTNIFISTLVSVATLSALILVLQVG